MSEEQQGLIEGRIIMINDLIARAMLLMLLKWITMEK